MTVLVIRRDDSFGQILRQAGLEVIDLELIETKPLKDLSVLREKLSRLADYDGLFFTSPVAANVFVSERKGTNGFHGNVYALGRRAQNVLETAGLDVRFVADANTAEEMMAALGESEFTGKRFLFVRGEKSVRTIPDVLQGKASIDEVAVYETVPIDIDEGRVKNVKVRLASGEIKWICFFSPSAVERFVELFGDHANDVNAAAIGATTARALTEAGFTVDFISPRSNADDFARGLIEQIKSIE